MSNLTPDVYEFHDDSQASQLDRIVSEIDTGTDIDLSDVEADDPQTEVKQHLDEQSDELAAKEVTINRPTLNPDRAGQSIEQTVYRNGTQYTIRIRRPGKCPSCGFQPQYSPDKYIEMASVTGDNAGKDELPELLGVCRICKEHGLEKQTCTNCQQTCKYCGKLMCDGCSYGYPEYGTLCYDCYCEVAEKEQNEVAFRLLQHHMEEKARLLRLETIREVEFRKLELEDRKHREQVRLEEARMEQQQRLQELMAWVRHQDNIRKRDLERLKFQVETEYRNRQQRLQAWKAVAANELQREKLDVEKEWKKGQLAVQQDRVDVQRDRVGVMEDKVDVQREKVDVQRERNKQLHDLQEQKLGFQQEKFDQTMDFREDKLEAQQDRFDRKMDVKEGQFREKMDFKRGKFQDQHQLRKQKHRFQQRQKGFENALKQDRHDLAMVKGTVDTLNSLDVDAGSNQQKVLKNVMKALGQLSDTTEPEIAATID